MGLLHECLELVPAHHAVFSTEYGDRPLAIVVSRAPFPAPGDAGTQPWISPFSAEFRDKAVPVPCSRPHGAMFLLHSGRAIYSAYGPLDAEQGESLSLHRTEADPPFVDRELSMLDALHYAHRSSALASGQAPAAEGLPPRQRQVLQALLEGRSEKEVAMQLGISRHTVHIYVKALYRRYAVCSRSELMSAVLGYGPRRAIPIRPAAVR